MQRSTFNRLAAVAVCAAIAAIAVGVQVGRASSSGSTSPGPTSWSSSTTPATGPLVVSPLAPFASSTLYPRPSRQLARAIHLQFRGTGEQTAACEAWVESRYNTERRVAGASWSASGDHGYWQINYASHHRPNESEWAFHVRLRPVAANAREAWEISSHGHDWSPWTGTYGRGLCHGLD